MMSCRMLGVMKAGSSQLCVLGLWAILALLLPTTHELASEASNPEIELLIQQLRSPSADDAVGALVERGEAALPALKACLGDEEFRFGCAEVLSRMPPPLAGPVLIKSIAGLKAEPHKVYPKAFLLGALGRLKWPDAVPFLEEQYEREQDRALRLSIAWALKNTTGREYGPSEVPWMMFK